jgi:2-methylcitrate dehydratase PrpD
VGSKDREFATRTQKLVEFASALRFEDIPPDIVDISKRMILDSLGCALAASTLGDGCKEVVSVMQALGGKPESTILGFNTKVAATGAAFANGALIHALNYDPIGADIGHVGVVCLAAPLALAEAEGIVSGKEFLTASIVACETVARITAAVARTGRHPSEKFLAGQLLGYFGAAIGGARILGLDPRQMNSALGLALMQMGGSRQIVLGGDYPAKSIYGAFPNQAGVLAALLARSGLQADCDIFGEPAGLYEMIYGGGLDLDILTDGLGTQFLIEEAEFKPWPTSNRLHPFIEAALAIAETEFRASDVAKIEVFANSKTSAWCEPIERKRRPENASAAANSVPFSIAKALANRRVDIKSFSEDGLVDADALTLASKLNCYLDEKTKDTLINVHLLDGQVLSCRVDQPSGSRQRPISDALLRAKFRDSCAYAETAIDTDGIETWNELILNLETHSDAGVIITGNW